MNAQNQVSEIQNDYSLLTSKPRDENKRKKLALPIEPVNDEKIISDMNDFFF